MDNVYNVHQKLSGFLEGSAIDKLAEASENIIELVRDNYDVSFSIPLTKTFVLWSILYLSYDIESFLFN